MPQHSTSPKSGGIQITVEYKKLNFTSNFIQYLIPHVDQVLQTPEEGRNVSLLDLVFCATRLTRPRSPLLVTSLFSFTDLYEMLVVTQDSFAFPSWFVKVINEVKICLQQVVTYLDDVIVV